MQNTVLAHFKRVDPILYQTILDEQFELEPITPSDIHMDYFSKLCDNIISQQLASKAADAISGRFFALFPDKNATPERVAQIPGQQLRDLGLSWAKVKYVLDLADKSKANQIRYQDFPTLSDDEIITELTQVKGIGRWTAEMFLIFTMGREDVFSFGDLGLKKGFQKIYQLDDARLLESLQKITPTWAPYRSYGSRILWKYADKYKRAAPPER